MYSSYEIAFDGKGEWSFGNDTAKNVIIFEVDKSSPSHTDNLKNVFLLIIIALLVSVSIYCYLMKYQRKHYYFTTQVIN